MRVVIDANVFVAALLRKDGVPRRVIDLVFERERLLWTTAIFDEINGVLRRPYFRLRVDAAEREALLALLVTLGERVDPSERIRVGRDPKDDKYLEQRFRERRRRSLPATAIYSRCIRFAAFESCHRRSFSNSLRARTGRYSAYSAAALGSRSFFSGAPRAPIW